MRQQVHLPAKDPLALKTRDKFLAGHDIITLSRVDNQQVGQCYDNVRKTVKSKGGEPYFGWVLTYIPNYFVEALHHCVWKTPKGEIVDITDKPFKGVEGDEVTFIPQNDITLGPIIDPSIPSWFYMLGDAPEVKKYVRTTREVVVKSGEFFAELEASGRPFKRTNDGQIHAKLLTTDTVVINLSERVKHLTSQKNLAAASLNALLLKEL